MHTRTHNQSILASERIALTHTHSKQITSLVYLFFDYSMLFALFLALPLLMPASMCSRFRFIHLLILFNKLLKWMIELRSSARPVLLPFDVFVHLFRSIFVVDAVAVAVIILNLWANKRGIARNQMIQFACLKVRDVQRIAIYRECDDVASCAVFLQFLACGYWTHSIPFCWQNIN